MRKSRTRNRRSPRRNRTAGSPAKSLSRPNNWFRRLPAHLYGFAGLWRRDYVGSAATNEKRLRYLVGTYCEEMQMKKTLAILATVATVGAAAVTAPAPAEARGGIGPGLAFGLAAGALFAGAAAASAYPYYYGPGYGYYGPRYYRPAYYGYGYGGPYAYSGGPYYYRQRYWRHYW